MPNPQPDGHEGGAFAPPSPDVVYVMREQAMSGSSTAELRYSLRSLWKHFPHQRVIVAGFKPKWMRNVEHIPTVQTASKWLNALNNLKAVLPEVAETFVLMNDDFFILQPVERMPILHRESWGPPPNVQPITEYQRSKANVRKVLAARGITEVTSYELHVPMVYERDPLQDILASVSGPDVAGYQRTLYGNLNRIGGSFMKDPHVGSNRSGWEELPFASTTDAAFRSRPGKRIMKLFPEPSPYECG